MKSTKNASEMRFNVPTTNRPAAAEIASPTIRQIETAKMSRNERSANHRMISTALKDSANCSPAFSLIIPNSSSSIGMRPVWRARAWKSAPSARSDAVRAIASVAARPGSSAPKSSLGSI